MDLERLARRLLLAVLVVLMAGFGLCGLLGSAMGVGMLFETGEGQAFAGAPLLFGVIGLLLALGLWFGVRAVWRSLRR